MKEINRKERETQKETDRQKFKLKFKQLNGPTNRSTDDDHGKNSACIVYMHANSVQVHECFLRFMNLVEMPLVEPHSKNSGVGSTGPGNYYSLSGTLLPD